MVGIVLLSTSAQIASSISTGLYAAEVPYAVIAYSDNYKKNKHGTRFLNLTRAINAYYAKRYLWSGQTSLLCETVSFHAMFCCQYGFSPPTVQYGGPEYGLSPQRPVRGTRSIIRCTWLCVHARANWFQLLHVIEGNIKIPIIIVIYCRSTARYTPPHACLSFSYP